MYNEPNDGDKVTSGGNLKLKGSSLVPKVGAKDRNIRRIEGCHNIAFGVWDHAASLCSGRAGVK